MAIAVRRSIDSVVGLLGILKAGAGYLPLDPSYPRERLEFMLGDVRPPVVITHSSLLAHLPALGDRALCLDRRGPGGSRRRPTNVGAASQRPTTLPI